MIQESEAKIVKIKVAKKPKLTHKQKRQVSSNRDKRLSKPQLTPEDNQLGEPQAGKVTGRFGKHADVEDALGISFDEIPLTPESICEAMTALQEDGP
jgi:hypothetical protein